MSSDDLKASTITFTQKEVKRLKRHGFVTASGVAYYEELAGPNGMSFLLIEEEGTSKDKLERAVDQLRSDHDVVGVIRVCKIVRCTEPDHALVQCV